MLQLIGIVFELVKLLICKIKNIPDVTTELCDNNSKVDYIVKHKNSECGSEKNAKFELINNSEKKVTQLYISLKTNGAPDFEFFSNGFKGEYIQLPPKSKTVLEIQNLEFQDSQNTFARMYVRYRDEAGRDKYGILLKVLKIKFNVEMLQRASLQWSEIS